jgi:hypothetical protein
LLCPRGYVTRFVLLFQGRTGSTYLLEACNRHPRVRFYGEELAWLNKEGTDAQLLWARGALTPPLMGRSLAIGFKTKLVDVIDPEAFAELLQEVRAKVIHMFRRNLVKAVVSEINASRLAKSTGRWNLWRGTNRPKPVPIDLGEFEFRLRRRERREAGLEHYVAGLQLPTLRLPYEDLLVNQGASLGRLFTFLRVFPAPVHGSTLKITSDDLRTAVPNFDEIRGRYVGTQYEPMFDEILVRDQADDGHQPNSQPDRGRN